MHCIFLNINSLTLTVKEQQIEECAGTCWSSRRFWSPAPGCSSRCAGGWSSCGSPDDHHNHRISSPASAPLSQAHPQTHPPAGPSSSAVPAAPSAPPGWGCTPGRWCPPSPRRRARPPAASAGRCPGSRWDSWLRDESRQEKNFELSEKLLQPVETGSNLFRRPYQNVTCLWCCIKGYRRCLWGRLPASSRGCLGPDTCWRRAASTTGTTSDSQRRGRLSARHTGHTGIDWERTACPVSSCLNAFSSTQCSLTL